MAIKRKLTKDEYKKLSATVQEHYIEQEDDTYLLETEGDEDTGALKRAKEHEKKARQKAEDNARKLQEQLEELRTQLEDLQDGAGGKKKKDDTDADAKWAAKLEKQRNDHAAATKRLQDALVNSAVEAQARALATELGGANAALLMPHVRARITGKIGEDGNVQLAYLEEDGTAGAMTVDDVKKSYLSNALFAPIVVGSKASGAGGAGGKGSGGGAPKKTLKEMTATEEAKFANEHPTEYQAMLEAAQQPR